MLSLLKYSLQLVSMVTNKGWHSLSLSIIVRTRCNLVLTTFKVALVSTTVSPFKLTALFRVLRRVPFQIDRFIQSVWSCPPSNGPLYSECYVVSPFKLTALFRVFGRVPLQMDRFIQSVTSCPLSNGPLYSECYVVSPFKLTALFRVFGRVPLQMDRFIQSVTSCPPSN